MVSHRRACGKNLLALTVCTVRLSFSWRSWKVRRAWASDSMGPRYFFTPGRSDLVVCRYVWVGGVRRRRTRDRGSRPGGRAGRAAARAPHQSGQSGRTKKAGPAGPRTGAGSGRKWEGGSSSSLEHHLPHFITPAPPHDGQNERSVEKDTLQSSTQRALIGATTTHESSARAHQATNNMKPMLFQGAVLNQAGEPIDGATIQVWQADPNGNYDHPRSSASQPESPEFESIIDDFQYFGTARSDSAGNFSFLTYRPGLYAVRPYSHFHFKVWAADPRGSSSEASGEIPRADLTTQFYFKDEKPPYPEELGLDVVEVEVGSGGSYHYGSFVNGTIVLDDGGKEGMLPLSPSQAEGPFYPLYDFFAYDNDLTTRGMTSEDVGEETEVSSSPTHSPVQNAVTRRLVTPRNDSSSPTAHSGSQFNRAGNRGIV